MVTNFVKPLACIHQPCPPSTLASPSNRPLLAHTLPPTTDHAWDGQPSSTSTIQRPRNPGYYTNPSRSQISL